jgi:crotonobetainyl-CoA:carnitine CoA-transferase CaiB-like acyl-CoA transferase
MLGEPDAEVIKIEESDRGDGGRACSASITAAAPPIGEITNRNKKVSRSTSRLPRTLSWCAS